ncbi:MAG: SDR family NAD(P)-dependent oxidoreductase, partial [Proteobacteria bacterium]|nr:SDR family NAD(P)-dependent oxidoreductase [Pseudomonadota bacterium]
LLSARDEKRLKEYIKAYIEFIDFHWESDTKDKQLDIADIAYTLQFGREPMEERLALIVENINQLKQSLIDTLEQKNPKKKKHHRYQGNINSENAVKMKNEKDIVNTALNKKDLDTLSQLWISGATIDWKVLQHQTSGKRISLPTYPFARERYWIPEAKSAASNALPSGNYQLHPLVHENISNLSAQCFKSTFTGTEFYLSDHVIQDRHILPGVAHLEMARAAVELSSAVKDGPAGIMLHNIVWARPLVVQNQPVQARIRLIPKENTRIAYEIYSQTRETDFLLHSQGTTTQLPVEKALTLDLMELENQCSQTKVSSTQVYQAFHVMGIDYGPSHQGIQALHIGSNQVLAKLCLPDSAMDTLDQYVLHPGLMDSALQASIGFMPDILTLENLKDKKPLLPFALESLEIYGPCKKNMWVFIRYSKTGTLTNHIQKLDMDLCDDQGKISCRMTGFTSRVLELPINQPTPGQNSFSDSIETMMWTPSWKEKRMPQDVLPPEYLQYLIICCELGTHLPQAVEAGVKDSKYRVLQSEEKSIAKRFQIYAVKIFEAIQEIIRQRPRGKVLIQVVIPEKEKQQPFMGLSGLLKTACLENRKISCQLICIDPDEDGQTIREKLKDNACLPNDQVIRYKNKKRLVAAWSEIKPVKEASRPWKDHGLYLITGGSGSLGLVFAQKIIQQAKGTRIILTGRTPLTRESESRISALNSSNTRVIFKQLDMTQEQDVNHLMSNIRQEHGDLNGVIHAAGVIHDNFILKKSRQEFIRVLDPKVTGLVHLDNATKDIELDCFILFSSVAGALGNPGQADYAAANAFMDAYAGYRNDLVERKKRHGQTLSMNWPLWKEGGMTVDPATEQMMFTAMGMVPMASSTGINALYQGMASGCRQVMVLEGQISRMKHHIQLNQEETRIAWINSGTEHTSKFSPSNSINNSGILLESTQKMLIMKASKILSISPEEIYPDGELSEYGFDSFALTEFSNLLNDEYDLGITPPIFFEHSNLGQFAKYLIQAYPVLFAEKFGIQENKSTETSENKSSWSRFTKPRQPEKNREKEDIGLRHPFEPVAIIGMSGSFPMAPTLEEFWNNLLQGKDCIEEIPTSRWDWQKYYGDPLSQNNKTNIKWGGFIKDAQEFDPLFFKISPKEAELMDPHQRLLMTYAWKAIEDAGYSAQSLSGSNTGIFVGTAESGYGVMILKAKLPIEGFTSTGQVSSVGPNRMSYFLNIHGPSEPIETACSSSLVAIHRALSALQNNTCEMAIAGGVNILVKPEFQISFNKAGMLCEDGRCKTFSDRANGYVRGEGVGMILLKKLSKAEQDKDHIYGILRGSAENHGGRANSLTAPNPKAQAELLKMVYTTAGIDPRTMTYIEAHGTGTELGDPIEIDALKTAFEELYQAAGASKAVTSHCGLGAVKTNIGHLELAAGIAGVIKVLLQLKHKTLVKTLHCNTLNPYIKLENSPFYILRETKPWDPLLDIQGNPIPLRAGISSFGFGGTNAHVVIEEYISKNDATAQIEINTDNPAMIILSAKNEYQLLKKAEQLVSGIEKNHYSDKDLADIAFTLQVGRDAMDFRMGLIAQSIRDLKDKLSEFIQGKEYIPGLYQGKVKTHKDILAVFSTDSDIEEAIETWVEKKKYAKLLDLWVRGMTINWDKFYNHIKPTRISLPTYPFARERYWIPEAKSAASNALPSGNYQLHPLVHENISNLSA